MESAHRLRICVQRSMDKLRAFCPPHGGTEGQRDREGEGPSLPGEGEDTCPNGRSNRVKVLNASSHFLTRQGILGCPLHRPARQHQQTPV